VWAVNPDNAKSGFLAVNTSYGWLNNVSDLIVSVPTNQRMSGNRLSQKERKRYDEPHSNLPTGTSQYLQS
jgi:hypothetical protein